MLTPLEVNNKEFKTRFRGYDVDEVEEFLEILSKDYEQLYKQNAMFTDKFELDRNGMPVSRSQKDLEDTLKQTLVLAQKASDDARKNAEENARLIVQAAQQEADRLIADAQEKVRSYENRVEELISIHNSFKAKMKGLLTSCNELLDSPDSELMLK